MSSVARVNKKLETSPEKYVPPTTMHVNLKKHKGLADVQVGKKVAFKGHGVVRSLHADEMGHTASIDIEHVEKHHGKSKEKHDEKES